MPQTLTFPYTDEIIAGDSQRDSPAIVCGIVSGGIMGRNGITCRGSS